MRAAFIRETGGVDKIEVGELPVPRPGPTDVLVRMEASDVNHVDLLVRSGAYSTYTPFPFVIGRDLVGTVVEAGPGVASFKKGDRVWCNSLGHDGRQGAFAEYAVVATDRLYTLPAEAEWKEAVSVLHTAATAHIGLVREARLQAGETIFVEGAGGGVGSAVVQLARAMGARIIATERPEDDAWVKGCGAEAVFDYHLEDLYAQVRNAAPDGIDVWWDNSGRHHFAGCLPIMRAKGRVIITSGMAGASAELPVRAMYTKDVTLHGFAISHASTFDLAQAARTINRLLASGRLQARVGASFHLSEAARAHAAMASGSVRGRIVVVP
ncbi:MAG: NADPH:quinone reductase [Acidobacteria bacterium]|nr:MAG: NADPH:quinone reductase [Acidobacteriota bacterium]